MKISHHERDGKRIQSVVFFDDELHRKSAKTHRFLSNVDNEGELRLFVDTDERGNIIMLEFIDYRGLPFTLEGATP